MGGSTTISNDHETLEKSDYEMLAAFRYQLRRFLNFSQAAARREGLTPRQHQALLCIVGNPGRETATISELANYLLIQHHSAVELVDRLVALDLVNREQDKTDKRKVLVSLTPAARERLKHMSVVHIAELRRIGPQLARLLASFGDATGA
ncbi:MarR family winged helix-turn-helix transcriptional regulator [Dongia soli]|uniref:MarR family transcriptional regulator n=1 Tax=Dongia soli TaxID=600628 RepID=A0ABU5EF10_9PROT|nr:MarR family transcriptional regulator [Dongia soli]MDY0884798.1 MarR family transcriptional regulator [Dongia soli]